MNYSKLIGKLRTRRLGASDQIQRTEAIRSGGQCSSLGNWPLAADDGEEEGPKIILGLQHSDPQRL